MSETRCGLDGHGLGLLNLVGEPSGKSWLLPGRYQIAEVKEEKSSLEGKMKYDAPIPAACIHDDVATEVSENRKQHTETY